MDPAPKKVIALFDVDGTLSESRKVRGGQVALKDQVAPPEIPAFLKRLLTKVDVGIVGGSDLSKQQEQLGKDSGYSCNNLLQLPPM